MPSILSKLAADLIRSLKPDHHQLVLAESCTAGLIASTIAGVPGASAVLIGSSVVYQVKTKQQWLDITDEHFNHFDVVSRPTSEAMATGVLEKAPWATIAASITGHLGPDAPAELDGIAWATVAIRRGDTKDLISTQQLHLDKTNSPNISPLQQRLERQAEAARQLMQLILDTTDGG